MCLMDAMVRALRNAVLADFMVAMTVPSVAQSSLVSAYQPDGSSQTQASGRSLPFKTSQDGSIRQMGAVGNQNVGSTTSKLITDPVIAGYVNRIGQNLAYNSKTQVQVTLKIIDTDEVNAFSLPGGFIFVDSGLILAADNEAELAAVISHEIAHVAARHAAQAVAQAERADPGSTPRIFRFVFRPFTLTTIDSNPTRSLESEADSFGVEYLYKAGYDPQALLSILVKIKAIEEQEAGNRANAFESRFLTSDRIRRARRKINAVLLPAREYRVNTTEFQAIKERLSELNKQRQSKTVNPTELVLR